MEPIKCTEEMDKFFQRLVEFKKQLKHEANCLALDGKASIVLEKLYEKLHEFFKIEGEE